LLFFELVKDDSANAFLSKCIITMVIDISNSAVKAHIMILFGLKIKDLLSIYN